MPLWPPTGKSRQASGGRPSRPSTVRTARARWVSPIPPGRIRAAAPTSRTSARVAGPASAGLTATTVRAGVGWCSASNRPWVSGVLGASDALGYLSPWSSGQTLRTQRLTFWCVRRVKGGVGDRLNGFGGHFGMVPDSRRDKMAGALGARRCASENEFSRLPAPPSRLPFPIQKNSIVKVICNLPFTERVILVRIQALS